MPSDASPLLILASSSPRRRRLLGRFGLPFEVLAPEVDESLRPGEEVEEHVRRLAVEKALTVAGKVSGAVVVAADTVVVLEGRIIGKPAGAAEAAVMLQSLSGRTHSVYTGIAVAFSGEVMTEVVRSLVTIAPMDDEEIRRYVQSGEPLDKAGAYAVQGEGGKFVSAVEGSLTNVIGLPLRELHRLLLRAGCSPELPGGMV